MNDPIGEEAAIPGDMKSQCRCCLWKLKKNLMSQDIFELWAEEENSGTTIAAEMAKIANVEIADIEGYPRRICFKCLDRLKSAIPLVKDIRKTQAILRSRLSSVEHGTDETWPKPIDIDRSLSEDVLRNSTDMEIKEEVVSDEECRDEDVEMEDALAEPEIKVEPEEMVEQPAIQVTVNGTISEDLHDRMTNGFEVFENEEYLDSHLPQIKEEPLSEDEADADLPKDCLLCSKRFLTLSGLKAHVIAHHNYKTVKRKFDGSISPEKKQDSSSGKPVVKYTCQICKRNFTTSTDLKVHEVCHDKFTCFACDSKFETFKAVTQHRRWCKAQETVVKPPKTLTDILKERKAMKELSAAIFEKDREHWECRQCMISFCNVVYYRRHNQTHHPESEKSQNKNKEMFVIEIDLKQEIKDVANNLKKEKEDAEYKKIETELESMFENPAESEKTCPNLSIDGDNGTKQLKENSIPQSDLDTIENILCSVNKDNGENVQLDSGDAFKHNSEDKDKVANALNDSSSNLKESGKDTDLKVDSTDKNELAKALNDSNSNLKESGKETDLKLDRTDKNELAKALNDSNSNLNESGTDIDSNMGTNNENNKLSQEDTRALKENVEQNDLFVESDNFGVLPKEVDGDSKENEYQNDSNLKANREESNHGIKEQHGQNEIKNNNKCTELTLENATVPCENIFQDDSIMETNNQNVIGELIQEDYSIPEENVSQNDWTIESNNAEVLSQDNHSVLNRNDSEKCEEVTQSSQIEINIDVNMECNNVDVLQELTQDNICDVKESDIQNCNEVAQPSEAKQLEDEAMDVDASDNNNEDKNTELDNTDKYELEAKIDGERNEKTDLIE